MEKKTTQQINSLEHDPVKDYAQRVCSGEIIAGPDVRNSCKRHLNDLEAGYLRGLVWDLAAALRAIEFFSVVLKLNGGKYEGKPFNLLNWQCFIVGSLFGWKRDSGFRRFRVGYVESGKGSGKSPLAAGIGLYGMTADGEARAEIYSAATKMDQAKILFRDAVAMVDQSPDLSSRVLKSGTGENAWNLAYLATSSFFRPVSSDTKSQSGPRPHIGIIDEYHEHKTNEILELIRAGFKFRTQPLLFVITNSGQKKQSPCGEYHDYGSQVCAGTVEDDEFFAYICSLDEGEDPFVSEECWPKVNPSLQASNLPTIEYLRGQVNEARGLPSKEGIVRRLNFCQWVETESPWLSRDIWINAGEEYYIDDLRGRKAYAGLDLSSTTDLTGFVLLIEPELANEKWKILPFGWLPEVGLSDKSKKDKVPYDVFVRNGHLLTTPGRAIKKTFILHKIAELSSFFNIKGIGYDRWRIADLIALAEEEGIDLPELIPFGQGFKDMSPAIDEFESMLLNNQISHDKNPVMTMCAANSVIEKDPTDARKLNKKKATGRIDLMIAALMAVGIKSKSPEEKRMSDDEFMEMIRNPL